MGDVVRLADFQADGGERARLTAALLRMNEEAAAKAARDWRADMTRQASERLRQTPGHQPGLFDGP